MDSKNGSLFLALLSLANWIISSNYKLADRYDVFAGLLLCVPLCLCARFQWGRSHKCPQNITAPQQQQQQKQRQYNQQQQR